VKPGSAANLAIQGLDGGHVPSKRCLRPARDQWQRTLWSGRGAGGDSLLECRDHRRADLRESGRERRGLPRFVGLLFHFANGRRHAIADGGHHIERLERAARRRARCRHRPLDRSGERLDIALAHRQQALEKIEPDLPERKVVCAWLDIPLLLDQRPSTLEQRPRAGRIIVQRNQRGYDSEVWKSNELSVAPHSVDAADPLERILEQGARRCAAVSDRDETCKLFDCLKVEGRRAWMPDANIINTARGNVLDAQALAEWLRANPAAAAMLDVHEPEPFGNDYPLLNVPNAYLAPHLASRTMTAMDNMSWVVKDVAAVLNGRAPRFPAW
jgi:hypothetical protein